MNASNFDGAEANSGGKISFDHRPHFRIPCQQTSSFKKPRPKIPISVNRLKNAVPFKSELCPVFQKGKCYHDKNYHYAHGVSELRRPESKPVAMEAHASASESKGMGGERGRGRERVCYFVASGVMCPYGDRCFYHHKCDGNLGRNYSGLMNGCRNAADSIECRSSGGGRNHHDKTVYYWKTKLCDKWERFGSCPYEMYCTYAHGRKELRGFGYYAKLEKAQDSRLMLGSPSSFAGSCRDGIEDDITEGRVPIMEWRISKMSGVYADWVGVGHDFSSFIE